MADDGESSVTLKRGSAVYTWEQIQAHTSNDDRWIVVENGVYDVTRWQNKHPGGSSMIKHFGGQDATEAFKAFHAPSIDYVSKFLKPLLIGRIAESEAPLRDHTVMEDFEELRKTVEGMGLFKSNFWFFFLTFLHIVALDIASYLILIRYGTGWLPWTLSVLCFSTAQTQLGWHQHDAGHLSVFKKSWMNRAYHQLTFSFMKGACSKWWNHMHYQHHSKPNIIGKDPDVRIEAIFVVGDEMPVTAAKKNLFKSPYNWQHKYFYFIGPPLLFPVYFQFMTIRHAITRRLWLDGILMVLFYVKFAYMYGPLLGITGTLVYYEVCRVIESNWFTWVSQSNHLPMTVRSDTVAGDTWLHQQLHATCDIEKSAFNDWFTGHLNHQIEHHLFPTMPRHNLYKITPLVKSLCAKHNIEYRVKTLGGSFADIIQMLKKSGELWLETYKELHV